MSEPATDVSIRLMTRRDIPAAQRLREAAGWNQTDADWENLLSFEPTGCFAAEVGGAVVGTATTTTYKNQSGALSLAWIGMVLVDPAQRRRGVGTALLQECLDYLQDLGVETIKLDATPDGKAVYDKLGFVDEYRLERWEGVAAPKLKSGSPEIKALTEVDTIFDYDSAVFDARRRMVLDARLRAWPECAAVSFAAGGQVSGYALARRGARLHQAGPIVANTPELAALLLDHVLEKMAGAPVIVDVPVANAWALELLRARGLKMQRPLIRMALGPNKSPGTPGKVLGICGPELG